jgi:hypothetical protein
MNKNEVKKELLKSKVCAKLRHYISGNLYYVVQLESGLYQFPIETVTMFQYNEDSHFDAIGATYDQGDSTYAYNLSSDLGTTAFNAEMKASELNRWIDKAIHKNEFIKIG